MSDFHTQKLTIDGMHCDACVRRVSQALGNVRGVRVHSVEVGSAEVIAQSACNDLMRDAIHDAGFTLVGVQSAAGHDGQG